MPDAFDRARRRLDPVLEHLDVADFVGPDTDIPAPDVATDALVMGWMVDEYNKIRRGHLVADLAEEQGSSLRVAADTQALSRIAEAVDAKGNARLFGNGKG